MIIITMIIIILNLCRSKISLWKNRGSLKEHEQKIKTWTGNSTGNADKKFTTTGKNDKTKKRRRKILEQKRKTQEKMKIKLEEMNQKVLAKEGRLTRYQEKVKHYKHGHSKTMKEHSTNKWGCDTKKHQQPDAREAEQFWSKI